MTNQDRNDCIEAAAHWFYLADKAEAMADWDRQHGHDLSPMGQSVGDRRAESYRRTAQSLLLEAETGIPHCNCHLGPASDCPRRRGSEL